MMRLTGQVGGDPVGAGEGPLDGRDGLALSLARQSVVLPGLSHLVVGSAGDHRGCKADRSCV